MVRHRGLRDLMCFLRDNFGLTPQDASIMSTSGGAQVSIFTTPCSRQMEEPASTAVLSPGKDLLPATTAAKEWGMQLDATLA